MSSHVKITLVSLVGCKGAEESERLIKEVILENRLSDIVTFEKITYTGTESEFNPPIYGSPTILINGIDAFAETSNCKISLA